MNPAGNGIVSSTYLGGNGNDFAYGVAAAEVGVGLAIVLLIYRNRKSVDLDEVAQMKG